LLFIGSFVGVQFYKGILTAPTVSSSTNPLVSSTNTNSNTNQTPNPSNSTSVNPTSITNSTTSSNNDTSKNTTNPQNLQFLFLTDNPTLTFNNKSNNENYNIEENKTLTEQIESETKSISKNYVYQTTTTTSSTSGSNLVEKDCFDKAYTYLDPSFIVIGGAILFINGKKVYFYLII